MTYENAPVAELVVSAAEALAELRAQGIDAHVYFKASCPQCGERCAFSEPDTTFDTMECSECGHVFPFVEGNYMLVNRRLPL